MIRQQQQLPQPVRVKVLKGFYATPINGQFGVQNPGDVVELDQHTGRMVVWANKGEETAEPVNRQTSFVPERKKNPRKDTQTLLEAMVEQTAANTAAINALVAALSKQAPAAEKEKPGK